MNFSGFFRIESLQQFARQLTGRLRRRRRRFDAIALVLIIAVAVVIRFWNLGEKALWLDEWLTLFIVNGYGSTDLPLDQILSFRDLTRILQPQPDADIIQTLDVLNRESTHPPLFFLLQHYWLRWKTEQATGGVMTPEQLPIALRTLPAYLGIAQTVVIFWVGRFAFSTRVGLLAAALTATSPLVVYLSQEARQYTLAMLCLALALGGLLMVVKCWQYGDLRARKAVVIWIVANTLGLYSHYLFLLAFAAQAIAIAVWLTRTQQWRKRWRFLTAVVPGFSLPLLLFSPWLWRLLVQVNRPETEWSRPFIAHWSDQLAPIGQTLVALLSAFTVLPLEGQPLPILIPLAVAILLFGVCLTLVISQGWQRLQQLASNSPESARLQERRKIMALMTVAIIAQMIAVFYLFGKNITIAPRYHAIYYPSLCLFVAIGLGGHAVSRPQFSKARTLKPFGFLPTISNHWRRTLVLGTLLFGLIGAICVTHNLAFQKGYTPREIAAQIQPDDRPTLTIATYENLQEIALGWSILWELGQRSTDPTRAQFALLDRTQGYDPIWSQLASGLPSVPVSESITDDSQPNEPTIPVSQAPANHNADRNSTLHPTLNLWVVAPGLRQAEFPEELTLSQTHRCTRDPDKYRRLGIPYQGYDCTQSS